MTDHDNDARDDEIFMRRTAWLMVAAMAIAGGCGVALMTLGSWLVA